MALKGDRLVYSNKIEWFMDEVATRGGCVVVSTTGSGAALDQATNLCTYAPNSSGKLPLGILLDDMVSVDLTRYKLNQHRSEVQQGGKVSIMDRGWVLTNSIVGTPTVGNAYLSSSGNLTATLNTLTETPLVGRFEDRPDEDGYVRVFVNLP
jgi:hypothetical protein